MEKREKRFIYAGVQRKCITPLALNYWHCVVSAVARKKPKTFRELQEAIIRIWNHELSVEYLQNLILSMPRRCAAVIKARDGSIKY